MNAVENEYAEKIYDKNLFDRNKYIQFEEQIRIISLSRDLPDSDLLECCKKLGTLFVSMDEKTKSVTEFFYSRAVRRIKFTLNANKDWLLS